MERESFENPAIAALMNEHFVNIKVDREERPDLDQIYQTAHVLMMRRSGGWPLTMFLTPDGAPFHGGTYFPRDGRYGLPGFLDLLPRVAAAYREQGAAIADDSGVCVDALDGQPGVVSAHYAGELADAPGIDRGALDDTVVGEGCKIDNLVQVGHNVRIGPFSVIAGCVGIAGSARIGTGCRIGGAAGILGHLEIADGVEVSPFTLVTRSIHQRGKVTGYMPVQEHDRWLQNAAQVRHLARMADRIKELEARLSALESNTGNGQPGDRAGMEGE
jgi:hypothetical protein